MAMEYALDPEDDITGDMNAKERRKYEIKAEGCYGTWDVEELENLTFDIKVTAVYLPYTTALESVKTRETADLSFIPKVSTVRMTGYRWNPCPRRTPI